MPSRQNLSTYVNLCLLLWFGRITHNPLPPMKIPESFHFFNAKPSIGEGLHCVNQDCTGQATYASIPPKAPAYSWAWEESHHKKVQFYLRRLLQRKILQFAWPHLGVDTKGTGKTWSTTPANINNCWIVHPWAVLTPGNRPASVKPKKARALEIDGLGFFWQSHKTPPTPPDLRKCCTSTSKSLQALESFVNFTRHDMTHWCRTPSNHYRWYWKDHISVSASQYGGKHILLHREGRMSFRATFLGKSLINQIWNVANDCRLTKVLLPTHMESNGSWICHTRRNRVGERHTKNTAAICEK